VAGNTPTFEIFGPETTIVRRTLHRLPLAAMLATLSLAATAEAAAPFVPAVVVENVTVTEGDAGMTAFEAKVYLDTLSAASGPYEVDITAMSSSATADDFVFTPVRLTLKYGETQVLKGFVLGDAMFEGDEAFWLHVERAPGVYTQFSTRGGIVTIVDDDQASAPRLTLPLPSRVPEGNDGFNTIDLPVTLSAPQAYPVTFDYATSDGSAGDYRAVAGTLTLAPGETVAQIVVQIVGDTAWEPPSTFTVTLANVKGAIADPASTTVTITNDDAPTTVNIEDQLAFEGDVGITTANLLLTLSGPASGLSTVQLSLMSGSARAGEDFVDRGLQSLALPPGATSMIIPIDVLGDRTPEGNEDIVIQYRGLETGDDTLRTTHLTILDDDVFVDAGTDLPPPPSDGSVIPPPDGGVPPPPKGDGSPDGGKGLPRRGGCCSVASGDSATSAIAALLLAAAALFARRRRATPAR
jgi:MYXO-CTERM domain-containing protein